jgi:hypothetical protein
VSERHAELLLFLSEAGRLTEAMAASLTKRGLARFVRIREFSCGCRPRVRHEKVALSRSHEDWCELDGNK